MANMIFTKEYGTVVNSKGKVILSKYFEKARVETNHTVRKYTKLSVIPLKEILVLVEGETKEKDGIYIVDSKVVCDTVITISKISK